jgi:hypothetical protein
MEPNIVHDLNLIHKSNDKEMIANLAPFGVALHEIVTKAEANRDDNIPPQLESMFLLYSATFLTF